ncbi:hypothetical protein F5B21DRAFT_119720 [Xylaria acuta]|nr:hypothetical protein F5B21DRAFT_119720 [Xylaria acuta]
MEMWLIIVVEGRSRLVIDGIAVCPVDVGYLYTTVGGRRLRPAREVCTARRATGDEGERGGGGWRPGGLPSARQQERARERRVGVGNVGFVGGIGEHGLPGRTMPDGWVLRPASERAKKDQRTHTQSRSRAVDAVSGLCRGRGGVEAVSQPVARARKRQPGGQEETMRGWHGWPTDDLTRAVAGTWLGCWDGMGRGRSAQRLFVSRLGYECSPDPVVACRLSGWEGQPGGSSETQGRSLD